MARPTMGNWGLLSSISGLSGIPGALKNTLEKTLELLPTAEDAYSLLFARGRKQERSLLSQEELQEDEPVAKRIKSQYGTDCSDMFRRVPEVMERIVPDPEPPFLPPTPTQLPCGSPPAPNSNHHQQHLAGANSHEHQHYTLSPPKAQRPEAILTFGSVMYMSTTSGGSPKIQGTEQENQPVVGLYTYQNVRPYQEDRASSLTRDGVTCLAINDGHAGSKTASFLQRHLLKNISGSLGPQGLALPGIELSRSLSTIFQQTNNQLRRMNYTCGSTATTVMMDGRQLVCANCGDSPAFVLTKSRDIYLISEDHAPSCISERRRIESAGGRISTLSWGGQMERVVSKDSLAGLAMTRAFGDYKFTGVICDPFVCIMEDMTEAQYVVVASDGLTESWSIEGAAHYIWQLVDENLSCAEIAKKATERAIQMGSRDNVTILVAEVTDYIQRVQDLDQTGCAVQVGVAPKQKDAATGKAADMDSCIVDIMECNEVVPSTFRTTSQEPPIPTPRVADLPLPDSSPSARIAAFVF
eukprot:gene14775-20824_t